MENIPVLSSTILKSQLNFTNSSYMGYKYNRVESKKKPFVGSFRFDDLLVACSQDIIDNGMETTSVPECIKSWVSSKLLESLPKKLVQKLLSFVLDNRDLKNNIGFKQNLNGSELTLFLFNNSIPKDANHTDTDNESNIFNNNEISNQGLDFCSDQFVIEQNSIIPTGTQLINNIPSASELSMIPIIPKSEVAKNSNKSESDINVTGTDHESYEEEFNKKEVPKKKKTDHKCPQCDDRFVNLSKMKNHLKTMHPNYEKKKQPTQAQKRLQEMAHMVLNPKPGEYTCIACNKTFSSAAHIVRHIDCVHNKLTKCKCNYCGKEFKENCKLTRHLDQVHCDLQNAKFKCFRCHRSFHYQANLVQHIADHNSKKLYKCKVCGAEIRRKDNLDVHMKKLHPARWQIEVEQRKKEMEETKAEKERMKASKGQSRKRTILSLYGHGLNTNYSNLPTLENSIKSSEMDDADGPKISEIDEKDNEDGKTQQVNFGMGNSTISNVMNGRKIEEVGRVETLRNEFINSTKLNNIETSSNIRNNIKTASNNLNILSKIPNLGDLSSQQQYRSSYNFPM